MRRILVALVLAHVPAPIAHGQGPIRLKPEATYAKPEATAERILVMPFENVAREGRIFWLTEAAAVLLTDNLNALGASAITREQRREAFDRLQVPPAAALTDATVIRLGQLVGASEVIVGALRMENDALVVQARAIAIEAGRLRVDVTERGPIPELFGTFERLARRLAPASPKSSEDLQRQQAPLAVFEDYVKGLLAETPETAITYLNAALKGHPTFDRARLALWDAYSDQGEYAEALAAVSAVRAESPWSRRARFLAGLSQIELKKYDEAFAAFKSLEGAAAQNNLGVVQLRRGSMPQTGRPAYYFDKAKETDRDDPDYFFNLGYAYWIERDLQAAIYWLREAVRRNPADGEAHFVLGAALMAAGTGTEAAREKELARRLSSTFEEWEKRPAAEQVPKGLERLKSDVELPHVRRIEASLTSGGQRDQEELAVFYLDRGRRLFLQENDREALADLDRALYLSPYLAEAHLLVGRIHLRGGRLREAVDALNISIWSTDTAEAHVVLAEVHLQAGNPELARSHAERALALDSGSQEAKRILGRK